MSSSENDVTSSIKIVLFGAAILGFVFPAAGVGLLPSIAIVGTLSYTYVALARARAKKTKEKSNNSDQ
jgi:hypothetical protein